MCVSQFRDYCKTSSFKSNERNKDLHDKNMIVRKGTTNYKGRNYYYVTDKTKLKELAKRNNIYAIQELSNKS